MGRYRDKPVLEDAMWNRVLPANCLHDGYSYLGRIFLWNQFCFIAVGPAVPPSTTLQEISKAADKCCVNKQVGGAGPVPCAGAPAVVVASQPSTSSALTPNQCISPSGLLCGSCSQTQTVGRAQSRTLRNWLEKCMVLEECNSNSLTTMVSQVVQCRVRKILC
uniref:Uncharacterized protein n=1 Tax=Ditylenchus dipsaci TaxID=166011 RepID=A0A915ELB9_9BILA